MTGPAGAGADRRADGRPDGRADGHADLARRPPSHVALLRGINVGGRNKVAMAALREVVAGLGHLGVTTYVNSGNVVFAAADQSEATSAMAASLERAVADALGVPARVVVAHAPAWRGIIAANPWPDHAAASPKTVHAVLFASLGPLRDGGSDVPGGLRLADAVGGAVERAAARGALDEARVVGTVVYLRTPDGFGRSTLVEELSRRRGGASVLGEGTARNWATMSALDRMLGS